MATNVLYNSTDALQKKYQKSLTDISPNATNANIKTFVQGLNALTNNTITAIRRVETTDILSDDTRLSRNMILSELNDDIPSAVNMSVPYTTIGTDQTGELFLLLNGTFDPDQLIVNCTGGVANGDTYIYISLFTEETPDETATSFILRRNRNSSVTATYTITMPADDTYQEGVVTLTVTAS